MFQYLFKINLVSKFIENPVNNIIRLCYINRSCMLQTREFDAQVTMSHVTYSV